MVNELDLSGQVMFFKEITNDLKNALVAKSNIFVMPSVKYKKISWGIRSNFTSNVL